MSEEEKNNNFKCEILVRLYFFCLCLLGVCLKLWSRNMDGQNMLDGEYNISEIKRAHIYEKC